MKKITKHFLTYIVSLKNKLITYEKENYSINDDCSNDNQLKFVCKKFASSNLWEFNL